MAEQDQMAEGSTQVHERLGAWQAPGADTRPHPPALSAGAYGPARQAEEGVRVLTEARAAAQLRGDLLWEGEMHQLTGEL